MLVFVFQHHHRANLRQILRGQSVLEQVLFDPQQVPSQIFLLGLLVPNVQMSKLSQSNKELFEIHKSFIKFYKMSIHAVSEWRHLTKKLEHLKLNLGWVLNFHRHLVPWRHDQLPRVPLLKNLPNLTGHVITHDQWESAMKDSPIRRHSNPLILSTIFCY